MRKLFHKNMVFKKDLGNTNVRLTMYKVLLFRFKRHLCKGQYNKLSKYNKT